MDISQVRVGSIATVYRYEHYSDGAGPYREEHSKSLAEALDTAHSGVRMDAEGFFYKTHPTLNPGTNGLCGML